MVSAACSFFHPNRAIISALGTSVEHTERPRSRAAAANAKSGVAIVDSRDCAKNSVRDSSSSRSTCTDSPANSYAPKKTSPRPPSRAATTLPWARLALATSCNRETGTMGFFRISASALIAAKPTRRPVNDPGPETTMKASISALLRPCLASRVAICGTNCAENVPPASGATSTTAASCRSCSPARARATVPFVPEVSVTRRSMPLFSLPVPCESAKIRLQPRLSLHQFQQHPARAGGMHEHVHVPARAGFDLFRNQAHAVLLQPLDRRGQVWHFQAYMVQAFAALGDKFCDRRIFRRGLEQFEATPADGNHHQADVLLFHRFFRRDAEAKLFVKRLGRRQRLHGDAEMVDLHHCAHSPLM